MASVGSDLNEHLCALVSNVQTQERCLELLNGISYNYDVATYYGRILVSRWDGLAARERWLPPGCVPAFSSTRTKRGWRGLPHIRSDQSSGGDAIGPRAQVSSNSVAPWAWDGTPLLHAPLPPLG